MGCTGCFIQQLSAGQSVLTVENENRFEDIAMRLGLGEIVS